MWGRLKHLQNGKLVGVHYVREDGLRIYLAHRLPAQTYKRERAWGIDTLTLNACKASGAAVVGVICRRDGGKHCWLALTEDWFDPTKSTPGYVKGSSMRVMKMRDFRIDPGKDVVLINTAVRIS